MLRISDFSLRSIDGVECSLSEYAGQVVLVVNVASNCAQTPQYAALEQLYRSFSLDGFCVWGCPCGQFDGAEPGDEASIAHFCSTHYDVTFPMAAKMDVSGPAQHPLFSWLTGADSLAPGAVAGNFEKFLIGRDGRLRARFDSAINPDDLDPYQMILDSLYSRI